MYNEKQDAKELYFFQKQLREQLAGIKRYPLTMVEAPTGFGKTTAVREFLKASLNPASSAYWYTCLSEPPTKAWQGICDLFGKIDDEAAASLIKLEFPTADTLADLVSLLRKVRCSIETYLVMDNYQLVGFDNPRQMIHAFSVHGNAKLHMVCITQPLKSGQESTAHNANIHTINSYDLMFSRESTGKYFRMAGITLSNNELDSVYNSTEGWVSAIRLQLLNYRQTGTFARTNDIDQLVKTAFWNKLTDKEKDFLLSVSVLDGFTTRQAQMMLGQGTLPDNILDLLDNNAFIRYFPDRDLYAMHSILQDYLRGLFTNHQPEEYRTPVLRRAGQACAAVADYYSAALFYCRISDFDAVLALPLDAVYLNNQKEKQILDFIVDFVNTCPEEILCRYPLSIVGFAFQLYMDGRREPFGKLCRLIASVIAKPDGLSRKELSRIKGEYALLLSFSAFNDIRKMSEGHRIALEYLDGPSMFLIPTTPWTFTNVSVLSMYWKKSGELINELAAMDECIPIYARLARGHGTGADTVIRAEALLLQGADADAEALCHKTLYLGRSRQQTGICLCAELVLARIAMLRGDTDGYRVALDRIRQYTASGSERFILRMTELCMATLALTLGDADGLADWLYDPESIKKVLYAPAVPHGLMLYSKMLIIGKRYNELCGLSGLILGMSEGMHYLLPQVYHLIYLAIAKHAQGRTEEAQTYLNRALAFALPDKVYLPFAEHGAALASLLETAKLSATDRKGIRSVMALARRQEAGMKAVKRALSPFKSPLTPRERDVALLAQKRLSAKEIAEALFITESTVRSALKTIYNKLDIHSKAELAHMDL